MRQLFCFKIILPVFFLIAFFSSSIYAQGLAGKWEGTLEVNATKKAAKQTFQFELNLEEFGEIVKGTSRISTMGKNGEYKFAVIEITGTFRNNIFTFKEVKVISQEGFTDPLDWCLKFGNLDFLVLQGKSQLTGNWQGKNGSGPCLPGTINVVKVN